MGNTYSLKRLRPGFKTLLRELVPFREFSNVQYRQKTQSTGFWILIAWGGSSCVIVASFQYRNELLYVCDPNKIFCLIWSFILLYLLIRIFEPYPQLTLCAKWTYNVHYDRTSESRNSKTRNDFLFRYETFLLTLS